MTCKICGNEMLVDKVEEKDDTLIFHYKCPNPKCSNFGYKSEEKEAETVAEMT